jgi:3-isopropylmalate dehydrogenase
VKARVVLLPGDGIGPEVVGAAAQVLERVSELHGHRIETSEHLIGGCAIDATGEPLPEATLEAARDADAILLGAVGGPKWSDPHASTRPEQGLLAIRSELGLFANVRPIVAHAQLLDASPLRRDLIEGVDIVFYRELTGGIYFGGSTTSDDGTEVADHMRYSVLEIERIVRLAADAARMRRGKVTSVDKANVLAVSRLWRRTADRIMATEYPDVEFENQLVDAMAMHLISRPKDFDVIVTGNLFGDILSDEASMIPGSLGLLPSASIGSSGPGLYEPIHGSAPDIAGTGTANPLAMILSLALAFRHSLGLPEEAASVELAVSRALDDGVRTPDIAFGGPTADTATMTAAVISHLG